MKVLIGHFGHEANTFAEKKTTYQDFIGRGIWLGEESIRKAEGTAVYLGGIIRAGREENVEMIPTCAYTCAAPTLTRECVEKMMAHILPVAQKHKGEIDGVCFALHGAGVAEGIDDLESYVLTELRKILGDIPITVSLDLHGNITEEMTSLAQGLFGIRKYPHTDKEQAGYLAMKTLVKILREKTRVQTVVQPLPLLVPISTGMTNNPPFPEMEDYFKCYVNREGLIDATFFHGFPYADVPGNRSSVVVVGEQGKDLQKAARELAEFVWSKRRYFKPESLSPAQAMDLAEKCKKDGFIVINEMSDNPGGGCPGDGTHLLGEMLKRNLPGTIFGYMVDPVAVEQLWDREVGEKVSFSLGGKHEKLFGPPIWVENAQLLAKSEGDFIYTSPNLRGAVGRLGKCVRVRVSNVEMIIGSVRNQTFDDQPFAVLGADINRYRYIGLKSTQHFRGFYGDKAAEIIPTDPPGLNSGNLAVFDFQKLQRPVYPLDETVEF